MKDKTHSMNMEAGGEGSMKGYTDAGSPVSQHTRKMRQLETVGLASVLQSECSPEALEFEERGGTQIGGFLRRNNTGDRN